MTEDRSTYSISDLVCSLYLRARGRQLLADLLGRDEHADFVRGLADDPDLATT